MLITLSAIASQPSSCGLAEPARVAQRQDAEDDAEDAAADQADDDAQDAPELGVVLRATSRSRVPSGNARRDRLGHRARQVRPGPPGGG